jgi:uncharacterized protein (TIGR03086 family)
MSSGVGDGRHRMTVPDLEAAASRLRDLLDRVPDSALGAPTPSVGTSVAALLDHLVGLTEAFRVAAAKEADPGPPPEASGDHLDPQWRTVLPKQLDALVAAWRDPAAGEGMATAGGVEMPASDMAVVALDELVLHGWDLARATGQPYEPDPADVRAILTFVEAFGSAEGTPGLFGPAVPVPDDAPAFDRALGLSGRDPGWRPPAR